GGQHLDLAVWAQALGVMPRQRLGAADHFGAVALHHNRQFHGSILALSRRLRPSVSFALSHKRRHSVPAGAAGGNRRPRGPPDSNASSGPVGPAGIPSRRATRLPVAPPPLQPPRRRWASGSTSPAAGKGQLRPAGSRTGKHVRSDSRPSTRPAS